jgi:DNA-binding CsgD family transcriptional regulator/PAS domain-containing protein
MDRRRSSHIVPEIYEATIDPTHWDYVISMVAKLTRSRSACLYYKNKTTAVASTIANYGLDANQLAELDKHLDLLEETFFAGDHTSSEDAGFALLHSDADETSSPEPGLFQDWMIPYQFRYAGGAQFVETETHKAGVILLRGEEDGEWNEGEMRVIDEILPHMNRALKIHSEFTHLRLKQDALLKGLDRLVIGLILYDRNARPVYINPTARTIIESHPALDMQKGDLWLVNSEDEKNLRKTIIETAEIDPDDSWRQSVAIGISHPDAELPLPLLVTPMHAHLITTDLDYEGAKVAVFLSDPNLQQPISIDSLVTVYNLTPSEAQVAISLANGHSIDQIARKSNHSAHTIRSQLKSVFRKTGVSRQSELIKLLLTGPFAQRRRSVAV